jgi:AraC family transcriptional regulator, transcriptional activator of pobA
MTGQGWPAAVARHTSDGRAPRRTPVTHSYASLVLYTGGGARVHQRGEWDLGVGDVLVVPSGEPHRVVERPRSEYWKLDFSASWFGAHATEALLEPFEKVRDGGSAVVGIRAARHRFVEELLRELEDVGRGPGNDARAVVQGSLLTLILNEVGKAAGSDVSPAGAVGGVVAESLRFIERHCLRRLTLDEVAAALGRSPAYVTTALTKATGRSAGAWIVSGRMAEARRLLLHSDEMVDVVAERVGYADATHFIRMFRRAHGATPAAWRAAQARATRALR